MPPETFDVGPGPCPVEDLGSAMGDAVRSGEIGSAPHRITSSCAGVSGPTATFLWTAPASGTFNFSTVGSTFDTVIGLLADGLCTARELSCNDDQSTNVDSRVDATLAGGDRVVVFVSGYDGELGTFMLSIWESVPAMEAVCDDGIDDDRDGLLDCQDDDCSVETYCVETNCTDDVDDDGDGTIDCDDGDCAIGEMCS